MIAYRKTCKHETTDKQIKQSFWQAVEHYFEGPVGRHIKYLETPVSLFISYFETAVNQLSLLVAKVWMIGSWEFKGLRKKGERKDLESERLHNSKYTQNCERKVA